MAPVPSMMTIPSEGRFEQAAQRVGAGAHGAEPRSILLHHPPVETLAGVKSDSMPSVRLRRYRGANVPLGLIHPYRRL
jgi:hypothetical protein